MTELNLDADVAQHLSNAAKAAGTSVSGLLRQVLHIRAVTDDPHVRNLFGRCGERTAQLLEGLDSHLRILNPGLHYVFRNTYLGYRREYSSEPAGSLSYRSQVFVSVVPRADELRIMLPLDPRPYTTIPGHRTVSGRGHHGVGELEVDLPDNAALDAFTNRFYQWLRPPCRVPPDA